MQLQTITSTGKKSTLTVSDSIFAAPRNEALISQAVRVYLANERQGTAKVKSRGEVNRTKKKVYKQKGTGGARHGAKSAPIFVGGGVTHGPRGNQNWSLTMSQTQKKRALVAALSWQADQIRVIDAVADVSGKTKELEVLLASFLADSGSVLVVLADKNTAVRRAAANLPKVCTVTASDITALDVVRANILILTTESIAALEKRLAVSSVSNTEAAKPVTPVRKATKKASGAVKAKTVKKTAIEK